MLIADFADWAGFFISAGIAGFCAIMKCRAEKKGECPYSTLDGDSFRSV